MPSLLLPDIEPRATAPTFQRPVEDYGQEAQGIAAAVAVASTASLIIRFVARKKGLGQKAGLWYDDWVALFCLPLVLYLCSVNIYFGHVGAFVDRSYTSRAFPTRKKLFMSQGHIYIITVGIVKMAPLLFYLRIFQFETKFRVVWWILSVINILWIPVILLTTLFTTILPKKHATKNDLSKPEIAQYIGQVVSNVGIDLLILLLPLPMISKLPLTWRRKIEIVLIFMLGYCTVAVSAVRAWSLRMPGKDYQSFFTLTWNAFEPGITLISVCVPAIYAATKFMLTEKILPSLGLGRSNQSKKEAQTGKMPPKESPERPANSDFRYNVDIDAQLRRLDV